MTADGALPAGPRTAAGPGRADLPGRPADLGTVHMVGIGGAGMSAIAALLAARGVRVQGSDAANGPAAHALRALGVDVHVGHDAAHVTGLGAGDTVVVSSAIRSTNPELAQACEAGLRVLHRSEALAVLMAGRRTVAVAGAHGKTTTSAMTAVALLAAGQDPSWVIGGTVRAADLPTGSGPLAGARHGAGRVLVAEADESDGSFLAYRPSVAVVTNVEPDHLDHYGSREAFEDAFRQFAGGVDPDGHLVVCLDDPGAARLAAAADRDGVAVVGYGRALGAQVRVGRWRPRDDGEPGGRVEVTQPAAIAGLAPAEAVLELAVPGEHNALNAAAAWVAARLVGAPAEAAADGLALFTGTGRRFEERGRVAGVRVVDDYAHHPTEVAALLAASRAVARDGRVLVLFQPHLFSRTRLFAEEFASALVAADEVVVTDVYAAREAPEPGVSGALLTEAMARLGGDGTFVPDRVAAATEIAERARPGDLVLTVGAGDVGELGPVVLAHLEVRGQRT